MHILFGLLALATATDPPGSPPGLMRVGATDEYDPVDLMSDYMLGMELGGTDPVSSALRTEKRLVISWMRDLKLNTRIHRGRLWEKLEKFRKETDAVVPGFASMKLFRDFFTQIWNIRHIDLGIVRNKVRTNALLKELYGECGFEAIQSVIRKRQNISTPRLTQNEFNQVLDILHDAI